MKFREVLSRLTGLSSPVFGVSWNPPEAEIQVARRVLTFLEDRRVLYVSSQMEMPEHCVRSVIEIRHYLTSELQGLGSNDGTLAESLRAMRAACRKFLNVVGHQDDTLRFGGHAGPWASWEFNGGLGEMRGVFGVHLARLVAAHGLDIEDGLATILPGDDAADEAG